MVCIYLTAGIAAHASELDDRVDRLVRMRFPARGSNVNCHGTSMAAIGALSVVVSLPNDESYFSTGCFKEVSQPEPGDVGFFTGGRFAFHSFVYLGPSEYFQKANPGWDQNPFERIRSTNIRDYFKSYMDSQLRWGRYQPAPNCFLTQFQTWLDQYRNDSAYSSIIQVMESDLKGTPIQGKLADFTKAIELLDGEQIPRPARLDGRHLPMRGVDALLHEFILRREFEIGRKQLIEKRTGELDQVLQAFLNSVRASPSLSDKLKADLIKARPLYTLDNIALYDNSRSAYFVFPLPDDVHLFRSLDPLSFDKFNLEQNLFHVELIPGELGNSLEIRSLRDGTLWTVQFST